MDKRIELICDYIRRHYQQKLVLEKLSEKVHLSPFYFQRLFKKEMNESPTNYINRVRLERAGHLLKAGTAYSMAQIAEDCGFSSAAVFNRAFKQRFGVSPLIYKQSPAQSIVILLQKEKIDSAAAEIVYLPDQYLYAVPTSIQNSNLVNDIDKAADFCQKNKVMVEGRKMGVLSHNTFHNPFADNNYHAGITVNAATADKFRDQLFFIPEGKFACFTTSESFQKAREVLMEFKIGWLDKSNYTWRELIAYEEFLPGTRNEDYPFLKRRVYIPIKRK